MLGLEQLAPEDRNVVARARRLERFLTQPFFTTEQFTGLKGKLVSLKDSLDGCERILRDEFKDYAESALYMIGAIGEAKATAKPVQTKAPAGPESKPEPGTPPGPVNPKDVKAKPDAVGDPGTGAPAPKGVATAVTKTTDTLAKPATATPVGPPKKPEAEVGHVAGAHDS